MMIFLAHRHSCKDNGRTALTERRSSKLEVTSWALYNCKKTISAHPLLRAVCGMGGEDDVSDENS
jgi:hypothetical protein